jgi:hypothetical protein
VFFSGVQAWREIFELRCSLFESAADIILVSEEELMWLESLVECYVVHHWQGGNQFTILKIMPAIDR